MNSERVTIVAEAGVNHNGSPELALRLVDAAADAGADAVKFQTFRAEKLVTRSAAKADYQLQTTDRGETQYEMLRKLELSEQAHRAVAHRCRERGIRFLSTPFDLDSLRLLVDVIGVEAIKLASGELNNGPLLHAAGKSGKPVILSTGMGSLEETESALAMLAHGYAGGDAAPDTASAAKVYASDAGKHAVRENVIVLQCTTAYPAAFPELNLRAMQTLRQAFGTRVGFSDHSLGLTAPIAATALGASLIEKHLTLDCGMKGPDHAASLDPGMMKRLVMAIRDVEAALGSGEKRPSATELANARVLRKSLAATTAVRKGERFTTTNLTVLRPGTGMSPMQYWAWLGREAARDYSAGELIEQ